MLLNPYRFAVAPTDPYWSNVTSLMRFNGADGSSTIVDQKGLTWVQSIDPVVLDTEFKKYGTSSAMGMTPAPGGNRLALSANSAFGFGTGDFTIEFWVKPDASSTVSYATIMQLNNGVFNHAIYFDSGNSFIFKFGEDRTKTGIIAGQWYHIAVVRTSGVVKCFVDGVLVGPDISTTTNYGSSLPCYLFATLSSGNYFRGWMDEFRVTKGVARYITNFTPPTAEFPNS